MIGKQVQYIITEYVLDAQASHYEVSSKTARFCRRPGALDYYLHQLDFVHPDQEVSLGIDHPCPGYPLPPLKNDRLTVCMVLEGKGSFNGMEFQSGSCFYIKPYQTLKPEYMPEFPLTQVWFSLNGSTAEKLLPLLEKAGKDQLLPFSHEEQLMQIACFFLYDCSYTYNPLLFVDGIIQQLSSFIHLAENARFDSGKASTHIRDIVAAAVSEIDKNLSNISVTSLATSLHLERKYFSRIFFEVMDITPQEYILQCKMNAAERFLTETELPIEQIINLVGYNHRNSLTASFKKQFGCSPSAYRERVKAERREKK